MNDKIHYYLALFPSEALIASQLEPEDFGSYMSVGPRKRAGEKLIFVELTQGDFNDAFDWNYAKAKCIPHKGGRKKASVYLSVYRALENIPIEVFGNLYLTTHDGRSLELTPAPLSDEKHADIYLYQSLCPTRPLVVSALSPSQYCQRLTSTASKIFVPRIVFADLKLLDFNNLENTGAITYKNLAHLKGCVDSVKDPALNKAMKTVDRSHMESFGYRMIDSGIYAGDQKSQIVYRMPSQHDIRNLNYEWARSSQIV